MYNWDRNPQESNWRPKMVDRIQGRASPTPRRCEHPGCDLPTRLKKPFCAKHIEHTPHARSVLSKIEDRHEELAAVEKGNLRAIKANSTVVEDILSYLEMQGEVTSLRLAKDLGITHKALTKYLQYLKRNKEIRTWTTTRGKMAVSLRNNPIDDEYCPNCNCESCLHYY